MHAMFVHRANIKHELVETIATYVVQDDISSLQVKLHAQNVMSVCIKNLKANHFVPYASMVNTLPTKDWTFAPSVAWANISSSSAKRRVQNVILAST